jgi:HD-GYP domain-containing protein (c-di-GMP phosphodiesterase class II)
MPSRRTARDRAAWLPEEAIEMMVGARGSHFAPDALDALLELMEREGIPSVGETGNGSPPDDVCHPKDSRVQSTEWMNRRTA